MTQNGKSQLEENIQKRLDFGTSPKDNSETRTPSEPSSFGEFFRSIAWKTTLILNLERAFSATLVLFIVAIIIAIISGETDFTSVHIGEWILWPFYLLPINIALGLALFYFNRRISPDKNIGCFILMWVFSIGYIIIIMLGDPLMFLLHRMRPSLVPVEKYRFFEFRPAIFIAK